MKKTGIVAIIGKPNVGKSTFFNRILGERKSIIHDQPGATRDRLYGKCEWLNQEFILIDTGGISIENAPFQLEIRAQVEVALEQADIIVFITNGQEGLTAEDENIAKLLYKTNKEIIVAVNKIDSKEKMDKVDEFWSLGLGTPHAISTTHGIGMGDLLDVVIHKLPKKEYSKAKDCLSFAIVGRPNVGKSSLANAILNEKRTIVSPIQGTTRDAVDTPFKYNDKKYNVIDTAGIRKSGRIFENLEKYSVLRSIRAIDKSNIVLLVIDPQQGIIEQDMHIAQLVQESKKGIIIVVNKWDEEVKTNKDMARYKKEVYAWLKFFKFVPIVFVSSLYKKRIHTIFNSLNLVEEAMEKRIQTSILNEVINNAILENEPSTFNGGKLNVLFSSQVTTKPPTFVFFVNSLEYIHFSYKRYLENKLRDYFGFEGTPILLLFRVRK